MEDGGWRTQTERLLLMDSRDFNVVGIGAGPSFHLGHAAWPALHACNWNVILIVAGAAITTIFLPAQPLHAWQKRA
jgi:hypothetical protein